MKIELLHATPNAEELISKCAGICYNSKGANIKRLKADGHLATFRFAHVTFKISGISRACGNQMVRHKFLDFLQRSQRYCNEENTEFIFPANMTTEQHQEYNVALATSKLSYQKLIELGMKKEDARLVLPLSITTEMVVTGSVQGWYDFLYGKAGRLQKAAQWEIRDVAIEIERQLNIIMPNIFKNDGVY